MDRQLVSLVANDKANLSSLISIGNEFQIMKPRYLNLNPMANLKKKSPFSYITKRCAGNKVDGILTLFRMNLFRFAHRAGNKSPKNMADNTEMFREEECITKLI